MPALPPGINEPSGAVRGFYYKTVNDMTRKEFIERATDAVARYLDDFDLFEPNPQLSVNPVTLYVDVVSGDTMEAGLADSDEAVEDAAAAEGDATEQYSDYQVRENPDYYPIKQFLIVKEGAPTEINHMAIGHLADKYV